MSIMLVGITYSKSDKDICQYYKKDLLLMLEVFFNERKIILQEYW